MMSQKFIYNSGMPLRSVLFVAALAILTIALVSGLVSYAGLLSAADTFWLKTAGGAILIAGSIMMLFGDRRSGERRSQVTAGALLIWGIAQFLPGRLSAVLVVPVAIALWAAVLRIPRRFFTPVS